MCDGHRAVRGLGDGFETHPGEPVEQHFRIQIRCEDGRRDPASAERHRAAMGEDLGEHGRVVTTDERGCRAHPETAVHPRHVVDEIDQRLRHRRARHRPDELVHLRCRPARLQRAANRGGGEAVHGRAAPALGLGHRDEAAGQIRAQWTGCHGR